MLRAEEHYPDPHTFKPERWLGKERSDPMHPLNVAFGFGRRYVYCACPVSVGAHQIIEPSQVLSGTIPR